MPKTRTIGIGVVAIAIVLFLVGFAYVRESERALFEAHQVSSTGECGHGSERPCPYTELNAMALPKYVGLTADIFLFIFGLWLFFQKPEKMPVKHISLDGEEKLIHQLLVASNGVMYQNELVEKTGFTKVKITRLLDRLEGKGLLERKRRGMTNAVVLKR